MATSLAEEAGKRSSRWAMLFNFKEAGDWLWRVERVKQLQWNFLCARGGAAMEEGESRSMPIPPFPPPSTPPPFPPPFHSVLSPACGGEDDSRSRFFSSCRPCFTSSGNLDSSETGIIRRPGTSDHSLVSGVSVRTTGGGGVLGGAGGGVGGGGDRGSKREQSFPPEECFADEVGERPCLASHRLRRFLIASSAWRWPILILWLVLGVSASTSCFMIIFSKEVEIQEDSVKTHCHAWTRSLSDKVSNSASEARTLGDLVNIFHYEAREGAGGRGGGGYSWNSVSNYVNATAYARKMVSEVAFVEWVLDQNRAEFERDVGWSIRDPGGGKAGKREAYAPMIFRQGKSSSGVGSHLPPVGTDMLATHEEMPDLLKRACQMRKGHALGSMNSEGIILEVSPFGRDESRNPLFLSTSSSSSSSASASSSPFSFPFSSSNGSSTNSNFTSPDSIQSLPLPHSMSTVSSSSSISSFGISPCRGFVLASLNFSGMVESLVHKTRLYAKVRAYVYDVTNASAPIMLYDPSGTKVPCSRTVRFSFKTKLCLGDDGRRYEMRCRNAQWTAFPKRAVEWTALLMLIVLLGAYIIWASTRSIRQMKRDMDRMQLLGEEMREAKNAAEVANKAKGSFLATISHEMRTPMNGVLGMLKLLSETPLDVTQHDYVETARICGNTLFSLINDVLDLSKIEAGCMVLEAIPFDLREEVDNVLGFFVEKSREQPCVELAAFLDDLLPDRVIGDPLRFRQVLVNLVGNALKFTQEGHIFICVRMAQPDEDVSLCSFVTTAAGGGVGGGAGGGGGGRDGLDLTGGGVTGKMRRRFSLGEKRRRNVEFMTTGGWDSSSSVSLGGGRGGGGGGSGRRWRNFELTSARSSPKFVGGEGTDKDASALMSRSLAGGGARVGAVVGDWWNRSKFISPVVMMDDDLTVDVTSVAGDSAWQKWIRMQTKDELGDNDDEGEGGGVSCNNLAAGGDVSGGFRQEEYPTLSGLAVVECPSSWSNIGESFSGRPVWCGTTADERPVRIVVSVEDTGCGIPWRAQKTVGKPFIQADTSTTRLHGGTGIGLSISQRLVRLMGGRMGFCSRPGLGSTFFFDMVLQTAFCPPPPSLDTSVSSLTVSEKSPTPLRPDLPSTPEVRELHFGLGDLEKNGAGTAVPMNVNIPPRVHQQQQPPPTTEDNVLEGLTVVVLDDKHVRRMVAACHLKRLGAWVEEVETIDQAADVLKMASLFIPPKSLLMSSSQTLQVISTPPLPLSPPMPPQPFTTAAPPPPHNKPSPLLRGRRGPVGAGAGKVEESPAPSLTSGYRRKFQLVVLDEGFVLKNGGYERDWRAALLRTSAAATGIMHPPPNSGTGVKALPPPSIQVNNASQTVQLLLIAAVRQPSSRAVAEEAGFDAVLVKPYRRNTLALCLSEVFTGSRSPTSVLSPAAGREGLGVGLGGVGSGRGASHCGDQSTAAAGSNSEVPGVGVEGGAGAGGRPPPAPLPAPEREHRAVSVAVGSSEQKAIFSSMCKILGKKQVLVVDDNCVNRKVVGKLLGRCGAKVTLVEGGRQAIEKLKEKPFDCIFMDVQMPEMDGFEATRRIRKMLKEGICHTCSVVVSNNNNCIVSKEGGAAAAAPPPPLPPPSPPPPIITLDEQSLSSSIAFSTLSSSEQQEQRRQPAPRASPILGPSPPLPHHDELSSGKIFQYHIPIIALTADIQPETRSKCYESGMDTFLTKPIVELELLRVLEECLIPNWERVVGRGPATTTGCSEWLRRYPVSLSAAPLRDLAPTSPSHRSDRFRRS